MEVPLHSALMDVLFNFSQKKTPLQAFLFYLFFGLVPIFGLLVLGALFGLTVAAVNALLLIIAFVLPSILTYLVVKGRGFPAKYYWLILLAIFMVRVGSGSDGHPAGLLTAMIVPAGLTSRKSNVSQS